MTDLEKLEAADKILDGSDINTDKFVDSLTRDGFVATLTKVDDEGNVDVEHLSYKDIYIQPDLDDKMDNNFINKK